MTRRGDVHWLYHKAGRFFPEEWAHFRDGAPNGDREDLVAARDWCAWEDAVVSLEDG